MIRLIEPQYSKSRLDRAGESFRNNTQSEEDTRILENWRAAHAYIINTFQANLRNRARLSNALVGQRLKRKPTILDKLKRFPKMQLSRMHDIAGCRVVFDSVDELLEFREQISQSRAKHKRITATRDQFNYIKDPKSSGYRGIHDVYKYRAMTESGSKWDNLLIEIQYRTRVQHAWATAVETADLLTRSRGKFSEANAEYEEFFRICSEILARYHEEMNSCLPNINEKQLIMRLYEIEHNQKILRLLKNTNKISPNKFSGAIDRGKNVVLIYPFLRDKTSKFILQVNSFSTAHDAIKCYEEKEKQWKDAADVVLVMSKDVNTLMKVFQNYFTDTKDFIKYIERATS